MEAWRLRHVDLGKFLDLFDGFLKSPIHIFMIESSLSSSFEQINLGKRCDLPGPLGLLLGALEGSLTASWGGLGPSWSGLMGLCWRNLIFDRFWDRFGSDFGDQKASQKGEKWSQKRTKIEHKIQHKIRRLSRASWIRPVPVLGRLGVDLGIKNNEHS